MKIIGVFIVLIIVVAGGVFFLPAESQAAWKKFVDQVDKTVGEESVSLAKLEKQATNLKKSWEKQILAKHQFISMADRYDEKSESIKSDLALLETKY